MLIAWNNYNFQVLPPGEGGGWMGGGGAWCVGGVKETLTNIPRHLAWHDMKPGLSGSRL